MRPGFFSPRGRNAEVRSSLGAAAFAARPHGPGGQETDRPSTALPPGAPTSPNFERARIRGREAES